MNREAILKHRIWGRGTGGMRGALFRLLRDWVSRAGNRLTGETIHLASWLYSDTRFALCGDIFRHDFSTSGVDHRRASTGVGGQHGTRNALLTPAARIERPMKAESGEHTGGE